MDPVRFGHKMRFWQRECARQAARLRFFVMVLHRRAGKTELLLKKLLDAAAKCFLPDPLYFYVAPQLKQAKLLAWTRLKQMVKPLVATGHIEVNESELLVEFTHNAAVLRLYGADNPDAMRGVTLDGVGGDEVGQWKPEVWEEILRPALADRKGWAWFLGTPKGINLLSVLYFASENRNGWGNARYTVYDTDALPDDEIAALKSEMSDQAFAREFLCDFAASGDDQLLSLADVEEAARRVYQENDVGHAARILGVDPARFGNDRSVVCPRQGLQTFAPAIYRGMNNMDLAGRVAMKIDQWNPDAVFIDAGGGQGVIDRLRQLHYDVVEVNFGSKAIDARYFNKRTEMWFTMADAIRAGLAIPNDNSLKLELATPTYKFTPANKIALESKDDIKKRMPGGASPDLADALALTYSFPVVAKQSGPVGIRKQPRNTEYDPYARGRMGA